jgi:hypothetical protein
MDDLMTLMIFAFLALMVAGVLFVLFYMLRSASGKRARPRPASSSHASLVEAAHLLRDKTTGMLLVALDGKLYPKASELTTAQRQRVNDAAMDLEKWLGQPVEPPAPRVTPPPPVASISPSPALVAPIIEQEPPQPVRPVSTSPMEALRRASKPPPTYLSIISQIDALLQGMLVGTALEKQGIGLAESADGSVLVRVGPNQYAGIDEVPDEEVRRVIRAAVAEWEKLHR